MTINFSPMGRFQPGDRVLWQKPYGGINKKSRIVCKVVKTTGAGYRVEYRDPLKGVLVRTVNRHNVVPFTGNWEVEKENLTMVRYGNLL